MASSRKLPKSSTLPLRVSQVLRRHVQRHDRLLLALSGGVDSVVLCDLLQRWCRQQGCELRALHINHQISPHAGGWARFCRALCRSRGIPLRVVKVVVATGNSLEAAARDARYQVFASQRADYVALAHHLDDQAETVLLQLLRGAGAKGLSAMPVLREAAGARREGSKSPPSILRPLLDVSRDEIEAYARQRKLAWIEDESNADSYFERNFLRHEILPRLARHYPAYRVTLARSGRNLAESAQLLDELAALDLDGIQSGDGVPVALLRKLGTARAKNALRFHLHRCGIMAPNAARLEECVRQALSARRDARLTLDLGGHELRYFSGKLFVVAKRGKAPAGYKKTWRGAARLRLEELDGTLTMQRVIGHGISLDKIGGKALTVRLRHGGEYLRPDAKRPRRSLKILLQQAGIPPWQRDRLPLLYCGETLVCVPGIGIDSAFGATSGEAGLNPRWESQ